jgi:hypothetical protein
MLKAKLKLLGGPAYTLGRALYQYIGGKIVRRGASRSALPRCPNF